MLGAVAVGSCTEKGTIAPDLGFLHINPRTVEILIPFEDFVTDIQVFGGHGSPQDLGRGVIALDFGGLNSRTLVHLVDFPTFAPVPGSLSFVGGRVVLVFDTVSGSLATPVDLELFDVKEEWHAPTVNWDVRVDTAGDRRFWTQPGGGPLTSVGGATFDAFIAKQVNDTLPLVDTVSIAVDSATVAALGDPNSGTTGLLLTVAEAGALLRLKEMSLFAFAVPSSQPDTVLEVEIPMEDLTFMVDPVPTAPMGWLRVGGAPSWRSVIEILLPRMVDGTVEVCGTVGCQVDLTEVEINLAELVLTTRQTESAFLPEDTLRMDVRRVLNPELLPKAPLGEMLVPFVESVPPELFSVQAGALVSLSVTDLVKAILINTTLTGTVPKTSMSLLSAIEPLMVGFASFEGGGGAGAPALRLLYTIANDVGLP
jgi:hypothetical protein